MASTRIPEKCPKCGSPDPQRHPALQFEGEVQPCTNYFHEIITGQNTRARVEKDRLEREAMGLQKPRRSFPVLTGSDGKEYERIGAPKTVPWELLAPHEEQALENHSQSLEKLASRGGLGLNEMLAIVEDKKWREVEHLTHEQALHGLLVHLCQLGLPK